MAGKRWKTIELFDDNGTTMAYQQKYLYNADNRGQPVDDHRVIPVRQLAE